ncbi:MAG TPA: methyltransferase [Chloroflexota bacterium]|nr:methyltransferase [Chloroflexota bacterium]
MSLALRNIVFTLVVPGAGAVYAPWWILRQSGPTPEPVAWYAGIVIVAGVTLYVACLLMFARVGRGTPGPWDPPRQFVAVGPYRWVRNPIYIAALLVMLGEAWLFVSGPLVLYAVAAAAGCHLFVVGYEEPHLRSRFGAEYAAYYAAVSRWIPRPPGAPAWRSQWAVFDHLRKA